MLSVTALFMLHPVAPSSSRKAATPTTHLKCTSASALAHDTLRGAAIRPAIGSTGADGLPLASCTVGRTIRRPPPSVPRDRDVQTATSAMTRFAPTVSGQRAPQGGGTDRSSPPGGYRRYSSGLFGATYHLWGAVQKFRKSCIDHEI